MRRTISTGMGSWSCARFERSRHQARPEAAALPPSTSSRTCLRPRSFTLPEDRTRWRTSRQFSVPKIATNLVGPIAEMSQFRSLGRRRSELIYRMRYKRRVRRRRSARCEKRGVKSDQGFGVAKLGTDGSAGGSRLLSSAWWTGPPPIPRRGPPRATNRIIRPPRRSPPREAARGFWIRAWGQRGPALQGTGRSNQQARWLWRRGEHEEVYSRFAQGLRDPRGGECSGSAPDEKPRSGETRVRAGRVRCRPRLGPGGGVILEARSSAS
jgi:hypothetical protein